MICILESGGRSVPGCGFGEGMVGDTKWEDCDRKEKSELMKSMG